MINHYHILGINKNANKNEIKAAYRKLAVLYHPDKNPDFVGAEEKFKEINQAYQILSDPEKRARHDLSLDYAYLILQFDKDTVNSTPRKTHRPANPQYRPYVYTRLERIGNMWAAGFLVVTIIITIVATNINAYLEEKRQRDLLENNIILFENARNDFNKGNYQAALIKLKDVTILYSERMDVFAFKEEIYKKVLIMGDTHFHELNFRSALSYYYLIIDNFPYVNVNVFNNIAACHKNLGNYTEAINQLLQLISRGYNEIGNHVEIGNISLKYLDNYVQAMEHYQISVKKVEEQYKKIYGPAYPILLNPSTTPQHHYEAYLGYGITCWHFGFFNKSIDALNWAIYLRPNNNDAYIAKGKCAMSMNNREMACESFTIAANRGSQDAQDLLMGTCQ